MDARRSRILSLTLAGVAALAAGCATTKAPVEKKPPAPAAAAKPAVEEKAEVRAWVELGSQGAVARAIVTGSGASCPELIVDGAPQPMTTRSASQSCFEVLVCEAPIPAGASAVSIGSTKLPLPPKSIKKIAIIGDTGCRLKGSSSCTQNAACQPDCEATTVQACNDPEEWPFAGVAGLVAAAKPDLVIHVGDYHYREALCPEGNKDCAGSPAGDNWPSWKADFFDPAAMLLAAAPWVMVRGNHEECSRAGWGWFRFLDPGPLPATCNDDPSPYPVQLPELQLLVLNTSSADSEQPPFYAPAYQTLNQLAAQGSTPSWLLSHHPLWAFAEDEGEVGMVTDVLQQALGSGGLDPKIGLVAAGHIHLFEALGFEASPPRVPSIVFGMSGTKLDDPINAKLVGETLDGAEVVTADTRDRFGYALAEPDADGWKFTIYSVKGNPKVACEVEGVTLKCEKKE